MSDMKLKYVGGSAKTSVGEAGVTVGRGEEATFDSSLAGRLLESGNWEEVKAATTHQTHQTKIEKEQK